MNLPHHLGELDKRGYTVLPGFLEPGVTAEIRTTLDRLAGPRVPMDAPAQQSRVHIFRHPIDDPLMPRLAANPRLLDLAKALLGIDEPGYGRLRLLEQVLIRTDPKPPPHGPGGWHIDWAFTAAEYEATPRQTYFHLVHCCNRVPPGGGAFMIVPGSHRLTYAATATLRGPEQLDEFKKDPIRHAGIDPAQGIEVCPEEGDLLIFNPMSLHSGSGNATAQPRYVYFASFFDRTAERLWQELCKIKYRDHFPPILRDGLPPHLGPLLEHAPGGGVAAAPPRP